MAAPFKLEDLAKLKSFVDFVAANPSVLNMPQLDFFKKLIEQLGGKVPEGTFQMPAGAKCPFGGDVKSENKSKTNDSFPEADDEEIPEMEAESEESEIELDMEDNNISILTPCVLPYIDGKPFEIIKSEQLVTRRSTRTSHIQTERASKQNECENKLNYNPEYNDPLNTIKQEIKCEIEIEQMKIENYNVGLTQMETDIYADYESKIEIENYFCYDEYENDDDDENEKLHSPKIEVKTNKSPRSVVCREMCRERCTEKFSETQRQRMFDYFWGLSKEEKLDFIRKHTKIKRVSLIKCNRKKQTGTSSRCYYLKDYGYCNEDADLIKVCRQYFEATLCIKYQFVKKAMEGCFSANKENSHIMNEKEKSKAKITSTFPQQQNLNSKTENISTVDAKAKKTVQKLQKPNEKRSKSKPDNLKSAHIPKPIHCAKRCIHKCHTKFTEEERKQICNVFWSLDYKRRKDFILANIEIRDVESQLAPDFRKTTRSNRSYQIRYFLRLGGTCGEKLRVCKHFYENTLCVQRYFISNAIQFVDKTTGNYTGNDRRGSRPPEYMATLKQGILDHINSYPTWIPNNESESKYLHYTLYVKKMYMEYKKKCLAEEQEFVSIYSYSKIFRNDFRLSFLIDPKSKKIPHSQINSNRLHYTGEEVGGYWTDSQGNKLDINLINPAESLNSNKSVQSVTVAPQNHRKSSAYQYPC